MLGLGEERVYRLGIWDLGASAHLGGLSLCSTIHIGPVTASCLFQPHTPLLVLSICLASEGILVFYLKSWN